MYSKCLKSRQVLFSDSQKLSGFQTILISDKSTIKFEIIEFNKRPVSAVADSQEIRNIRSVEIFLDFSIQKQCVLPAK